MQRVITLLLAVMAVFALAAPTPKALSTVTLGSKIGSFKAVTQGRRHRHHHHGNSTSTGRNLFRDPRAEIERAYRKFNWAITFVTPSGQSFTLGLPDSSSSGGLGGFGSSSGSGTGSPSVDPTNSAVQTGSSGSGSGSSATYSAVPSATSAASAASAAKESGEVSATPEENESEYLSPVKIGGQTLNLDFDTGSADL